jgi:hypothetical protein
MVLPNITQEPSVGRRAADGGNDFLVLEKGSESQELLVVSGSRTCRALAPSPASVTTLVSDVLDERAQFGQHLAPAGVVQKNPWRSDGEWRQ